MGNEIVIAVIFTFILVAVGAAWVGGYLDAYQSKAQEKALDMMGENKASYGIKSSLTGQKTGDEDLNKLQNDVGEGVGGLVGKGGIAESAGQIVHEHLPPGITLVTAEDFKEWQMDIRILDPNPLYLNKTYRLRFRFSNNYPIEAPEVTFITREDREIPMHPHIYSNGIICLDLLGSAGWSPVQNVESVCMSIQSMLTGNSKNERPPDNEDLVRRNPQRPRDIRFHYEDDTV
ncbi:hypothetical protein MMC08_001277 [Hypocenomyce scalaris]|nr:hypothetical protein [Hypocenomyce scalaris]